MRQRIMLLPIARTCIVVSLLAVPLLQPAPALANPGNCVSLGSSYYDGHKVPADVNTWGTRATITAQSSQLCNGTNPFDFASDWVMFSFNTNSKGYAQAGFFQGRGIVPTQYYSETNIDGQIIHEVRKLIPVPIPTIGSAVLYTVVWSASCSCEQTYYGLTKMDQTAYNPLALGHFGNAYSAEATHTETDIAGDSSHIALYQNLGTQVPLSTTWQAPTGMVGLHDAGNWYVGAVVFNGFETYTINP